MADINLEAVTGKLNQVGHEAFFQALRHAKRSGHRNVELAHWLFHILQKNSTDISLTADHYKLDRAKLLSDIGSVIEGFRKNETEMPSISPQITDLLDRGWYYATLFFGETQIRTGHMLVAALKSDGLKNAVRQLSKALGELDADRILQEARTVWAQSDEENLRPMDGSGLAARDAGAEGGEASPRGNTALDRFSNDMTAAAAAGKMDPIVGRDEEIRQIIDVLMRQTARIRNRRDQHSSSPSWTAADSRVIYRCAQFCHE